MSILSNQIIEAMPIAPINEFKIKAICLMSDLVEELEMRFDTLTADEINFLKVLQSSGGEQGGFNSMCEAFGKIMYSHQVLEDMYDTAAFQSRINREKGCRFGDAEEVKYDFNTR